MLVANLASKQRLSFLTQVFVNIFINKYLLYLLLKTYTISSAKEFCYSLIGFGHMDLSLLKSTMRKITIKHIHGSTFGTYKSWYTGI